LLGLSVVFQQRLRTDGVLSQGSNNDEREVEIARWFATGAIIKVI
jgi:hypothetical protein